MNLDPVIALLQDGKFKRVADIMAFAKIGSAPNLQLPAAYVVPDREVASDAAQGSMIFEQVVQTSFSVILLVNVDGARAGVAADALDALEMDVLDKLFAIQPAGFDSPLGLVDISTVEISAAWVARAMRFRGRRRIRRTLSHA